MKLKNVCVTVAALVLAVSMTRLRQLFFYCCFYL